MAYYTYIYIYTITCLDLACFRYNKLGTFSIYDHMFKVYLSTLRIYVCFSIVYY